MAAAAASPLVQAAGSGPGFQILHLERLQPAEKRLADGGTTVSFDAFGRRFDLALRPNERMRNAVARSGAAVEALRGEVSGVPGSWVRLTKSATGLAGMVYASGQVYVIEPARDAAPFSVQALAGTAGGAVMYRLADTLMPGGLGLCATEPRPKSGAAATGPAPLVNSGRATGLAAWQALGTELQALAATLPSKQIVVGAVADYEMSQLFGDQTEATVVARMNIVDGIFSSQVGVKIQLAPITVFRDTNDPFTASDASTLLGELRTWRGSTPAQLADGLTHLMTGRDMTGDTVGIAYIATICDGAFAASLSEGWRSTTNAALIAAHEIGHNFGAPHDGDPAEACAATPLTFLMAPTLNGSNQFSQCSLDQIRPVVAVARCVTTVAATDAALDAASSTSANAGTPFTLGFTVRSIGSSTVTGVQTTTTLPAALTLNSASAQNGSCTSGAGTVACALGDIPAGESRSVSLSVTGNAPGDSTVTHSLAAANDTDSTNNSRSVAVHVNPVADIALTAVANPSTVSVDGVTTVSVTLANRSATAATGLSLSVTVPAGLALTAVDANSLNCVVAAGELSCPTGQTLAGNSSVQLRLSVTGRQSGVYAITGQAASSLPDPDATNNSGQAAVTVLAPAGSSGGGGGGGGAMELLSLLALLGALAMRATGYVPTRPAA
ncbi:MAG: M12 family metallo-peptidase [Steroidobacteraceae bacterium]